MLELIAEGGIWMIPLNLAGLAIVLLGVERVYSLYVVKNHARANLHKRLLSLRFLGAAAVLTGIIGTLVGLFQAFSMAGELPEPFPIFEVARIAMTTSIWGLSVALLALVLGFVIRAKVEGIDRMRLES